MKKLLVLLMVLGMATTSQAAISFTASGAVGHDLTVSAGQTITIQVKADGTCWGFEISAVEASSVNANGQATAIADKDGSMSGYSTTMTDDGSTVANYNGALLAYAAAHGSSASGNVLASFTYVVGPSVGYWVAPFQNGVTGAIPVDSNPANNFDAYGYGSVGTNGSDLVYGLHLIPEPMTLVLLGLGGLFLRRRK